MKLKIWLTAILSLSPFCLAQDKEIAEEDKVVIIDNDDKEMATAFKKAKNSIGYFLSHYKNPADNEEHFAVKYKVVDGDNSEYFWLTNIMVKDGKFTGTLNNVPNNVKNVKMGQKIHFVEKEITDWLFLRDGKMFGNFTLYPLLKNTPEEKREMLKNLLAPLETVEAEITKFNKKAEAKKAPAVEK